MRHAGLGWLCVLMAACGAASRSSPPAAKVAPPTTIEGKRALFTRAHGAVVSGHYAETIPMLETLCPVYTELQDYCLHDLAVSRAHAGDGATADVVWAQLVSTQPQSLYTARANLERGRWRRSQGDLAGARPLLESARASEDDEVAVQASLELAELERAAGEPDAAAADLMVVRARAPGSAADREAKQLLDDLRRQNPQLQPQGPALENELRVSLKERDFAAARDAADRLLATAPAEERPEILRLRADSELGAGQFDQGLATLQQIVRQYPDSAAAPEAQFRYATLLWNRNRNQEAEQAFVEFRRRYPDSSHMPEVLYALGRIAQSDGRADEAARIYAQLADAYPSAPLAHEARWRIGWMRYQQGRYSEAAAAFERAAAGTDAATGSDARYWRARALERAGDRGAATDIYRALVAETPGSYYAYWADRRLGRAPGRSPAVAAPAPTRIEAAPLDADPYHWTRARELQAIGWREPARAELRAFERGNSDRPVGIAPLLKAYQSVDGYRDAIRLASARGLTDPDIFYPLAFWPQVTAHTRSDDLDPFLVLALMRQESMFDPGARSSADARGLMQLLPSTADRAARRAGEPSPAGKLYDPDTNIALGTAHLQQLLQTYQGDQLKALAAYNGGEEAVARWQRSFGSLDEDEFVESITYRETRDYVKRVIGNYRRYRQQYGGA